VVIRSELVFHRKRCADTIRVGLDGIPGWLSALAN
jgi:hypothetical protein